MTKELSNTNRQFKNNEGGFYKQLNSGGEQGESEVPDAKKAKQFWTDMWSTEVEHNREAEWLEDFKTKMNAGPRQAEVNVTLRENKEDPQKSTKLEGTWTRWCTRILAKKFHNNAYIFGEIFH